MSSVVLKESAVACQRQLAVGVSSKLNGAFHVAHLDVGAPTDDELAKLLLVDGNADETKTGQRKQPFQSVVAGVRLRQLVPRSGLELVESQADAAESAEVVGDVLQR